MNRCSLPGRCHTGKCPERRTPTPSAEERDFVDSDSFCEEIPADVRLVESSKVVALLEDVENQQTQPQEECMARRKCHLQVAKAPYHACVAFNNVNFDRERQQVARQQTPDLLKPQTRSLFQEIQQMGQFPRRCLQGGDGLRRAAPYATTGGIDESFPEWCKSSTNVASGELSETHMKLAKPPEKQQVRRVLIPSRWGPSKKKFSHVPMPVLAYQLANSKF